MNNVLAIENGFRGGHVRTHKLFRSIAMLAMLAGCAGESALPIGADTQIDGVQQAAASVPRPVIVEVPETSIKGPPSGFTNQQVLGFVPDGLECPEGNGDWEPITALNRPGLSRPGSSGAAPIVRFCGFRFRHEGVPANAFTAPSYCPRNHPCCNGSTTTTCGTPRVGEDWLEPDDGGAYVSALPTVASDAIVKAIRQQHRAAMGTPASFPRGKHHFTELPRKIKVYVLDNSDADHPGVHGDAVASWIKQTACPEGGDCGLWIEKRKVIEDNGKGSVIKLALAILDAVDEAAGFPTLINLSLQVHPTRVFEANRQPHVGDDVSPHQWRFAHRLLEAALNYARCHGVLVVSAAGNRDGGPNPFPGYGIWGGNVAYPAAYDEENQGWVCNGESSAVGRLTLSVGGILADGSDSPSRRENGQACLVAPSTGLAVDGSPMEGTSFSAAAMTGAIASVWRYAPFASAHDVVGMLTQWSQTIARGARSKGCSFGSAQGDSTGYSDVRRINLCKGIREALNRACNAASAAGVGSREKLYRSACFMKDLACPDTIDVSAIAQTATAQSAMLLQTAQDLALQRAFASGVASVPQPGLCSGALSADPSHRNTRSCPDQMLDNGTILANGPGTSPGGIGCLGCSVLRLADSSLWLYGTLFSESVSSPALSVIRSGTTGGQGMLFSAVAFEQTYELGNILAQPGQTFAIQLESSVPVDSVIEATFAYTDSSPGTQDTAHTNGVPVIQAN